MSLVKKRWELRLFNWILKNRRAHLQKLLNDGKAIHVGLKTIYKEPVNGVIKIHHDKVAIFRVSIYGLFFGLLILFGLLKANHWSLANILLILFMSSPFLGYGIYFFIQSQKKHKPWLVDINQGSIVLSTVTVPFDHVEHLNFTRLIHVDDVLKFNKHYDYSLNMMLKDKNEITLFTDRDEQSIRDAGAYLTTMTKIPLYEQMKNA